MPSCYRPALGNPLYRWDYHKETGYKWWMKRIAHCYKALRCNKDRPFQRL
ncbi:4-alpha-glucanotransferase [Butyrivibrio sp. FCS014]